MTIMYAVAVDAMQAVLESPENGGKCMRTVVLWTIEITTIVCVNVLCIFYFCLVKSHQ